ncbi:MAG: FMN reductase [Devosia sp.]|nr:FMN reductase [Devosia sp.]
MTEQLNPIRIVAFSGNVQRPSKSRALAETIAETIAQKLPASIEQYDVLDGQPGLGTALSRADLSPEALSVVEAIEKADVLVVSTPTYKGSYTGLFKHLIDFVDPKALNGVPVVISATGGGQRHALTIEHQLRPLFGFFSAWTIPAGIFAEDKNFEDGRPADPALLARIELAANQVVAAFPGRRATLSDAETLSG